MKKRYAIGNPSCHVIMFQPLGERLEIEIPSGAVSHLDMTEEEHRLLDTDPRLEVKPA